MIRPHSDGRVALPTVGLHQVPGPPWHCADTDRLVTHLQTLVGAAQVAASGLGASAAYLAAALEDAASGCRAERP